MNDNEIEFYETHLREVNKWFSATIKEQQLLLKVSMTLNMVLGGMLVASLFYIAGRRCLSATKIGMKTIK